MPPLCESEATPLPPLPDEGLILEFENDPTPLIAVAGFDGVMTHTGSRVVDPVLIGSYPET